MDKEKRKKWDMEYRKKHTERVKESQKKYSMSEGCKAKQKEWRDNNKDKIKESWRKYSNENRDKIRKKYKRYYDTDKGTVNMLRKHDVRRFGIKDSLLTLGIIKMVNERDTNCIYCRCEFNDNIEYDHINPFRPFSKFNILRCCKKCNKEKSKANMKEWMNFMGYKISEKLEELYKKAYE